VPVHMQYPELRPVALEAEARALRKKAIPLIRYKPKSKDVSTMLAVPGSITVFMARKGSKILDEVRAAVEGQADEAKLTKRLVEHFNSRRRVSVEQAVKMLQKEDVFADIRHGGTTVAASLFHPDGLECCVVVLPYNGGRLVRGGLTLIERVKGWIPNPDDPDGGPLPGDPLPPIPEPEPGPDPSPELEAIALVHPPRLTRVEKEALARVPASQLELNLGKASDCTAVTGIAVAAVVVLLVVAIMTAGCAAFEIPALSEARVRQLGSLATARELLAARRNAIEAMAVR